ncbi:hypothetical protein K9U39_13515 [Rhodoblastus acidophilus]|uniref:Uncharacterized protein n=1 Tax=Candidatus Rhodoblastus alkanivorans TaxID=2954117 RepID=A0ABS9ZAP6_9HYPH|nr:hypothetical protein [Candidatus Rhodoblastus alkanivorans]MCI4677875.1 hypothetical protein [Candidatus Rhodoblastus alkanivorans]MCI4684626.1 hypothetical protein [Candidatus Rhodoblastus alkanivorans]MDI4641948.1 hypothetical protein [Rhodoblastus acidophilus]
MASRKERDPEIIPLICQFVARRNRIQEEDVAALARFCRNHAELSPGEAESLFALARAGLPSCPEWGDFFAETLSAWFVEDYAGHDVGVGAARHLITWLGGDDARLNPACFRLLTQVLERAAHCPEELLAFARACLMRAMGVERLAPKPDVQVA